MTEAASDNKTMLTTRKKLILYYGVAVAAAVTVITLVTFTVTLIVVIVKMKNKRSHCSHQGKGNWMSACSYVHTSNMKQANL